MNRSSILFVFSFCLTVPNTISAVAQPDGWFDQTSNTTRFLTGVSFYDSDNGVVVGVGGAILWTTNGGSLWVSQGDAGQVILYGVSMPAPNMAIAVGSAGTILRTTNGGSIWESQISGAVDDLYGVCFADQNTGTVVGGNGTILHTTNGGATWQIQISGTPENLYGVSFVSATTGLAVGGFGPGVILKTTNGGTAWQQQTSGTSSILTSVSTVDQSNATAVGLNGTILRTTNGGSSWFAQISGTLDPFYGVRCVNTSIAFVSSSGGIRRTTDGGVQWSLQGGTSGVRSIHMIDELTGTAVGEAGRILRTHTGGMYGWVAQVSGTNERLNGVAFADANHGLAVGERVIVKTSDGGATWFPSLPDSSFILSGISFPHPTTATAVGQQGVILRTTDGGGSWFLQTSGTQSSFGGVHFVDVNIGYAVGTGILKTTDGGTTWVSQLSTGSFSAVHFYDADHGIAVGAGLMGFIRWTTNGGQTWNPQTSGRFVPLSAGVFMTSQTNAVAVGTYIRRTFDGGATWPDSSTTGGLLKSVSFAGPNIGTAVGTRILRTTDGGSHWTPQLNGSGEQLRGVSMLSSSTGVAVGESGAIFRTTTGGVFTDVTADARGIPEAYFLEQNYPNPFNPITTIQFTLPHHGFTKLTIYDVLGAEVTTLVASELPAGLHLLRWDASNRASGVYFYRLESGTRVETKKLILLR